MFDYNGIKMFHFRSNAMGRQFETLFIDGLPHFLAHKVKDKLTDITGLIKYDNFTYGDIILLKNLLFVMIKNVTTIVENY